MDVLLVTEIEQPLWRTANHTVINPKGMRLPQEVELATQDCKKMVAVLEEPMKHRDFLVGEHLSVADFNAAYTLDSASEGKMLGDAPRLREFVKTMYVDAGTATPACIAVPVRGRIRNCPQGASSGRAETGLAYA